MVYSERGGNIRVCGQGFAFEALYTLFSSDLKAYVPIEWTWGIVGVFLLFCNTILVEITYKITWNNKYM